MSQLSQELYVLYIYIDYIQGIYDSVKEYIRGLKRLLYSQREDLTWLGKVLLWLIILIIHYNKIPTYCIMSS